MKIVTDIEQGTPEWLALRLGIATASELDCLMVNGKGEAGFAVAAFTYMDQLIGERITEEAAELPFQTEATIRGHELEQVARPLRGQGTRKYDLGRHHASSIHLTRW